MFYYAMDKPRILSGEELVAKGITKSDASLPEIGLKDITPNGSWLEQKQVQAALEARKYLVEVERIEKCGTLSHAVWHDDLKLAEVTQKVGGHWQYLGHNIGKTLYLRPEEALYLMEVNCLLLKHNEVTVSIQKAYALLIYSSTSLIQYKVYASLSRLGYKVFRHKPLKVNNEKKSCCQIVDVENESKNVDSPTISTGNESENVDSPIISTGNESENVDSTIISTGNESENADSAIVSTVNKTENSVSPVVSTEIVSKNVDSPMVKTLTDSENIDCPMEPQVDKVSEKNEQEGVTNIESNKTIAKNNISKEITEQCDSQNDTAKDNESLIVMEVDETAETTSTENVSESNSIQEVSITVVDNVPATKSYKDNNYIVHNDGEKNANNKTDILETCAENNQPSNSGIVLMDDKDDRNKNKGDTAVDENSDSTKIQEMDNVTTDEAVSGSKDSGICNIEENTKFQEDLLKDKDLSISNNSAATDEQSQINSNRKSFNFIYNYLSKIDKLTKRQLKPSDSNSIKAHFENIPDLFKKEVVTVNVPEQPFIPKNIYVNKSNYLLNLQNIKQRSFRSASTELSSYTSSDEVNGANVRRIRSRSDTEFSHNQNFYPEVRFPKHLHFRPYGFWRPQNNLNFYQFSMFFQRPPLPNMYFQSRIQYQPRANPFLRSCPHPGNLNSNDSNVNHNVRKRTRNGRAALLQAIKNLAVRLKQMVLSGNTDLRNLESLHNLLYSYNFKYKARLRLTQHFDVVNEEKILETIELDDDEESKSKKPRLDENDSDKFDENLNKLRQLALRLKDLETNDKATAIHRRAFSKAIKTFNKSYNADVYLDDETYNVINRRLITLDSSSESDCVVEEEPKVQKGKKLRNPFNILKRRSERLKSLNNPSTSKEDNSVSSKTVHDRDEAVDENTYNEFIIKTFDKTWLPNENDFGRAEIVPRRFMNSRLLDCGKDQYLYDFMKDQCDEYQNWLEAKISFQRHLEETNIAFQNETARILADSELCNIGLRPLIDSGDSSDLPAVLEKLRIINNNKDIESETCLCIDFDVYNRDVQNFRKRNPPKPHFRIICLDESSSLPSAAHVMALHSKYEDNVAIVFAIVGLGSISYLQINPIDLPIYVQSTDV